MSQADNGGDSNDLRADSRSADEIRASGAIGGLGDGIEIDTHGVSTRLLAWPGTGYQTETVHVLTLQPSDESERYTYDLAEEAMLCNKGSGEVWLHDGWVEIRPGDLAYFPEGVEHGVRNPKDNADPLVLVSQITPPQFDLYTAHGFYNDEMCVMDNEAIRKASFNVQPASLDRENEMAFHDTDSDLRNWNMKPSEVRRTGALFNVFMGAPFSGIGLPMRLILWPGAGSRTAGFNYAFGADGVQDVLHTHPVSDECLFIWEGKGSFFVAGRWIDVQAGDCVLAPCGVAHGHRSDGPAYFGGYASPPQLDLLMPTDYYENGIFTAPRATRLEPDSSG